MSMSCLSPAIKVKDTECWDTESTQEAQHLKGNQASRWTRQINESYLLQDVESIRGIKWGKER